MPEKKETRAYETSAVIKHHRSNFNFRKGALIHFQVSGEDIFFIDSYKNDMNFKGIVL